MRWQIGWLGVVARHPAVRGRFVSRFVPLSRRANPQQRRRTVSALPSADLPPSADGTLVYVQVYSSMYLGVSARARTVDLAATVSVRNTSSLHPITLTWVRYYDSSGKKVRDYLEKSSALPPLGSVEFVIQRSDMAGGPGANFLIRWDGPCGCRSALD